jgi:plastocyanin
VCQPIVDEVFALRSSILRRSALSLPVAVALLLGACTSAESPSQGGAASTGASPDLSACAQVEDGVVTITAEELEFDVPCMVANAGEAFTIHLVNMDNMPHDVAVYDNEDQSNEIMRDEPITGPDAEIDYEVPAQEAGEYYFLCTIHPTMNGALYVVEA